MFRSQIRPIPPALISFLEPYGDDVTQLFLQVRDTVLAKCPEANELIYDSYNAVSCVYTFTQSISDGFCHIASYAQHVNLGFNQGVQLVDSEGKLQGSGKRIRHLRISDAGGLVESGSDSLLDQAIAIASAQIRSADASGTSVVKSVSKRKRRP